MNLTCACSSAGVLKPDESCVDKRFTNSVNKSSIRPIRCDIRCISNCESHFISKTVAIKSRCANVLDCSRKPLSYVSVRDDDDSRSMEADFSKRSFVAASRSVD